MTTTIPIVVHATDPLSRAGMTAELLGHPEIRLVEPAEIDTSTVGIVAAESLGNGTLEELRELNARGCQQIVLVVDDPTGVGLMAAVDCGVRVVVRRNEITNDELAGYVVRAANGAGFLPEDILGQLLRQVARLQRNVLTPMGLSASGCTAREIEVLRLVAAGLDTNEIARALTYSERTIKNILHDITDRFQLKNRSHAVAFAVREGLI